MDTQKLAELLFPHITTLPTDIEAKFPPRALPEGAKVTRFAPSPTGFVHFGGLFPTTVAERLAHQSGGVLYLRIDMIAISMLGRKEVLSTQWMQVGTILYQN